MGSIDAGGRLGRRDLHGPQRRRCDRVLRTRRGNSIYTAFVRCDVRRTRSTGRSFGTLAGRGDWAPPAASSRATSTARRSVTSRSIPGPNGSPEARRLQLWASLLRLRPSPPATPPAFTSSMAVAVPGPRCALALLGLAGVLRSPTTRPRLLSAPITARRPGTIRDVASKIAQGEPSASVGLQRRT